MTPGLLTTLTELHDWSGTYDLVIPRTEATVWQWCRTAGKDAGIERVHPHLFRSTAATAMLRSGGRVHAVSSVLGHSSIKTTQRYLAVDEDDRKLALAGLAVAGL
jgi:integrase